MERIDDLIVLDGQIYIGDGRQIFEQLKKNNLEDTIIKLQKLEL